MSKSSRPAFSFFEPGAEPSGIDDAALRRARSAIDKLKRAYVTEWAPAAIDELERAILIARSSPEQAPEQLDAIFRLAHDMKGQGATFGYAMISDIGGALCNLTDHRLTATHAELEAMLANVRAARTIIQNRLEDPDSPEAQSLRDDLLQTVRSHLH